MNPKPCRKEMAKARLRSTPPSATPGWQTARGSLLPATVPPNSKKTNKIKKVA
jgi:hypothetical protein